jgi:hypothetical protein
MNANSEVMQPVATSLARQVETEGRGNAVEPMTQRADGQRPRAVEHRTSEDPMRRTDRYRLVMPYSNRV